MNALGKLGGRQTVAGAGGYAEPARDERPAGWPWSHKLVVGNDMASAQGHFLFVPRSRPEAEVPIAVLPQTGKETPPALHPCLPLCPLVAGGSGAW